MQENKKIKQTKSSQNQHSHRLFVRFELAAFIIWNSIAAFGKSIVTVHIPAVDQSVGGRISHVIRFFFAIITLEGPRLMLISRYRAARMEKGKKVGISAAGGTAIAAVIIASILIGSQLIAVTIDGKIIGYVENEGQYASLLQQAKEKVSAQVGTEAPEILIDDGDVTLETVIAPQQQAMAPAYPADDGTGEIAAANAEAALNPEESLLDSLIDTLIGGKAIKAQLYNITINGEVFATMATMKDASDVLKAVEQSYTPQKGEFIGKWLDEVAISTITADLNEVNPQDPDEVIAMMLAGTSKEISYTTVEEDSVEVIAAALGISQADLERAYPDYDFEEITAGAVFSTTHNMPFVRYETRGTETVSAPIAFAKIEEKSDELFLGQKEVDQEGELGERIVTRMVTSINGVVVNETEIASELVKEPVDEITLIGTKLVYSGVEAYVGPSDGVGGGGNGILGRPLNAWYLSRSVTSYHNGADMLAAQGTPIFAAESGFVTFSGYSGGYGNLVVIDHGNGLKTLYAHCDTLNVTVGDGVSRGQQIATVGSTGRSTAYHLHFEVRVNDVVQDPLSWIG